LWFKQQENEMTIFQSALDDFQFYLGRGANRVGAAWAVAAMYRDVTDEKQLAQRLLDHQQ
jgi:hypothetical protein